MSSRTLKRLRRVLASRLRAGAAVLAVVLVLSLVWVAAARTWVALITTLVALSVAVAVAFAGALTQATRARRTAQDLRGRLDRAEQNLAALRETVDGLRKEERASKHFTRSAALRLYDAERRHSGPSDVRLPADRVLVAAEALIGRGDVLDAYALLRSTRLLPGLDEHHQHLLRSALKDRGYLRHALDVARLRINDAPQWLQELWCGHEGEIAVLSGEAGFSLPQEIPAPEPVAGRVLHLVGSSLPGTQAGYTIRTQSIAVSQRRAGLDPHVATHLGFGCATADLTSGHVTDYVDEIPHHRAPGLAKGKLPLGEWLRLHIDRTAELVRSLRPAIIHAASDFLNAQTAITVGRAFGIPVIYETRGFWEETWLSRRIIEHEWDLDRLAAEHGLPDVYVWRKAIEDRLRVEADHVVTLDAVMADRIADGGVPRERITVIPNAVESDRFPVLTRDAALSEELGIREGTTVIGYISSLNHYEGIDTLISAFAIARQSAGPVALLIVGDGAEADPLREQARELGLDDVLFTGKVPHADVLRYYSVIDIFVVPRHPVDVCHLVTPLKPFEAFSTGRAVVLSDVRALAGIAAESGAAELFTAGDPQSLAGVLKTLIENPARRQELASTGAAWVREHRTWGMNAERYVRLYDDLTRRPG